MRADVGRPIGAALRIDTGRAGRAGVGSDEYPKHTRYFGHARLDDSGWLVLSELLGIDQFARYSPDQRTGHDLRCNGMRSQYGQHAVAVDVQHAVHRRADLDWNCDGRVNRSGAAWLAG